MCVTLDLGLEHSEKKKNENKNNFYRNHSDVFQQKRNQTNKISLNKKLESSKESFVASGRHELASSSYKTPGIHENKTMKLSTIWQSSWRRTTNTPHPHCEDELYSFVVVPALPDSENVFENFLFVCMSLRKKPQQIVKQFNDIFSFSVGQIPKLPRVSEYLKFWSALNKVGILTNASQKHDDNNSDICHCVSGIVWYHASTS